MILNGKAFIPYEKAMRLLGYEKKININVPTYRKKFANIEKLKMGGAVYFEQKAVYEMLQEKEAKSEFLCSVQSLAIMICEDSGLSNKEVALKLGFKEPNALQKFNNWLENTTYTKTTARVLVCAYRNFPHLVKQFDEAVA